MTTPLWHPRELTPEDDAAPFDPDQGPMLLRVVDLKQWAYCPRVVYFTYTLPTPRPRPFRLEEGQRVHQALQQRWQRRGLPRTLRKGTPRWEVPLMAPELRLSGKVDVLLEATDGRAWPVDIKHARRAFPGWKVQVAAYGLLVETVLGHTVPAGYLYLSRVRRAEEVRLTRSLRAKVRRLVNEIWQHIAQHRAPEPTRQRGRCVGCEFRRFCNDVF